jgi:hypothetical protein
MPILTIVLRNCSAFFCWLLLPGVLAAQSSPEIAEILARLKHLEQQNQELAQEVHQLREELAATRAPAAPAAAVETLEEKVAVNRSRTQDLAQTKVEASQHFPIRITGMALFNGYLNSKGSAGYQYPLYAWPGSEASGGGSLRQTTLGLEYQGPRTFLKGKISGSIYMDFWGGSGAFLNQDFRIRTAKIQMDWDSRSLMAGLESPIFAPRQPASLAQVAYAPLSGAGNLWQWIPQVRFEQQFHFDEQSGLRAQVGIVQTVESYGYEGYGPQPEPARPGVEGRFEFYHSWDDTRRIEFAPGFHFSSTHVAGGSLPSDLFSLDWRMVPAARLEFTGAFYTGRNVGHLGALESFTILPSGAVLAVHSQGGWGQFTIPATSRLSFHLFSGMEADRGADLRAGAIARNWMYGANFFYRLAPNVLLALESSQARTTYLDAGYRLNNHYDLALAYLF